MFPGLPEPLPRSPVPFLSDANDADMDDTSQPFSISTFELQAAANALSSRIVEHIRSQSPQLGTSNDPMVQKLREER
jgi:histidinol-phosphate/aromatic aminotransferase/cobyric acid decarboxylase-like protein